MPPGPGPRVVVLGILGRTPFAGVAWQGLHYLEGLRRLGYDVYYLEDTETWPYDPERNAVTDDCSYTVRYLGTAMAWAGFAERWAYRTPRPDSRTYGLGPAQVEALLAHSDALINLTGGTVLREEHLRVPVRIYLETDPVLPQIEVAQGRARTIDFLRAHTHHFSFGENLGAPDCGVPVEGFQWRPTRQPVVLDWWRAPAPAADTAPFTTIANWRQSHRDIEWHGERYGWSKDVEFLKFLDLPSRTARPLELALACDDGQALARLAGHGWRVRDALRLSQDILPYRRYIWESRGEFTVAKDQNIRLRSGWFSDRSACYLAAGRPVVTQDTGFGKFVPTGRGLFAFTAPEEIVDALERIDRDYALHAAAAQALADEYFAAERVLRPLMAAAAL
jgi:hypothetical protein